METMNGVSKERIENPAGYEAVIGEKLEMHFRITSLPLLNKIQQGIIKNRLNVNPAYKVVETSSTENEFIVTIVIVKNPFPLVLAIGGVITACAGFFIWASLDKVYKIIETPTGRIISMGAVAGAVMAVVAALMFLKGGR